MNRFLKAAGIEDEMDKEASILGLLGMAGLMHVAPNIAMKAVKSTKRGNKALAGSFSAGVNHGKTGRKLHPNVNNFMGYGMGPEALLDYNVGKRMGQGLKKYEGNPERQKVYQDRIRKKFNIQEDVPSKLDKLRSAPVIGSAMRHFEGSGSKRVEKFLTKMSVPENAVKTKAQKGGDIAMLAGAGAADPTLLMQPALAYGRKKASETSYGRKILQNNFTAALGGKEVPKWKERLIDTAVSPGILDTHRLGKMTRDRVGAENVEQFKNVTKKLM